MPEQFSIEDFEDDLISKEGEYQEGVDAPGIDSYDFDEEPDEIDEINLYDLNPNLLQNLDLDKGDSSVEGQSGASATSQHTSDHDDIVIDLLRSKGIENVDAINYENEDGTISTVSFFDLPYEDQLGILKSNDSDINFGFSNEELGTIGFLRENGVTLEQAIEYFQRKAVEDHINSQSISGLDVDQYSDEDLFTLNLRTDYPELTEDEITLALEKQKEHPDLFKKLASKLRTDYKEIELRQAEDTRLEASREEEQKRKELEDNLIDVATTIQDIGGLTLDDADRNLVLDHLLSKDLTGVSPFLKSLNSPDKLFQLAWYAVKGQEAFDIIHDYYKKEIANVSKAAFEKGKASVSGTQPQAKPNSRQSYQRKGGQQTLGSPLNRPGEGRNLSIDDIQID